MELAVLNVDGGEISDEDIESLKFKISSIDVVDGVEDIIEKLECKDRDEMLKKLLSYTINSERVGTSDSIGYDRDETDRLYKEYLSEQKATKRKKGRRN